MPNYILPCKSPQCGGYTLEAELGITPNGYSEPDFMGWEVKQFGVTKFENINSSIITLHQALLERGEMLHLNVCGETCRIVKASVMPQHESVGVSLEKRHAGRMSTPTEHGFAGTPRQARLRTGTAWHRAFGA
jgi:hypothetical protein